MQSAAQLQDQLAQAGSGDFIAVITKDEFSVSRHATELEAAEWVCAELGPDYGQHFWVADGKLCASGACWDFSARVYSLLDHELFAVISSIINGG